MSNVLGIGYHLTIVRNRLSKSKRISRLIKSFIPHSRFEGKVGAELAYILPREMVSLFEDLFNAIERSRQSLGIDSYGASVTTMEEVFIRYCQACCLMLPCSDIVAWFSMALLLCDIIHFIAKHFVMIVAPQKSID